MTDLTANNMFEFGQCDMAITYKMRFILVLSLVYIAFTTQYAWAKNCSKGKPCGNTCIAINKQCHLDKASTQQASGIAPAYDVDMSALVQRQANEIARLSRPQDENKYLNGYDISESKVIIISMPDDDYQVMNAEELGAQISSVGGVVTAETGDNTLKDYYLYEWISPSGTRIFSTEKPHWYANADYPEDEKPITKVYGRYGLKIDDTSESDYLLEQRVLLQQRIHSSAQREAEKQRREWQARVDAGIIEIGYTMKEVLMIWGYPKDREVEGNTITYIYETSERDREKREILTTKTFVRFRGGAVNEIDYKTTKLPYEN